MRVHVLGSGSEGNATVIESDRECIIIDAGFGVREQIVERPRRVDSPDLAQSAEQRRSDRGVRRRLDG